MNILLIEDDLADIEYIKEVLKDHNITIRNNPSLVEDVEGYDFIIIDYFYGTESAYEFLISLDRKKKFKSPILLTSGKVDMIPLDRLPSSLNILVLSKNEKFRELLTHYLNLFESTSSDDDEDPGKVDYKTLYMDLVHDLRNDLGYSLNYEQFKEIGFDTQEKELEILRLVKDSALFCYHRLEQLSQYLNTDDEVFGSGHDAIKLISNSTIVSDNIDSLFVVGGEYKINKVPLFFLSVILKNLIENACKSKSPSRSLKIKLSFVPGEGHINIIINDNGVGMPEEKAASLFDKKLNSKNGLGVGLVILSRIIKSFQGKIIVASNVGKGTTISIHFPN